MYMLYRQTCRPNTYTYKIIIIEIKDTTDRQTDRQTFRNLNVLFLMERKFWVFSSNAIQFKRKK